MRVNTWMSAKTKARLTAIAERLGLRSPAGHPSMAKAIDYLAEAQERADEEIRLTNEAEQAKIAQVRKDFDDQLSKLINDHKEDK